MNDEFLINFAISTLVAITFAMQHVSQILFRMVSPTKANDKNTTLVAGIIVLQLFSVAIIIQLIRYALSK